MVKVYHYSEVESEVAEQGAKGVTVRWLITKETGAPNFAMRLFEVEPGGFTPLHTHPWEHEVFILEGQGIVVGGDEERRFGEWDVIFIPPEAKHQLRNVGDKPLKFLCLIPYKKEP